MKAVGIRGVGSRFGRSDGNAPTCLRDSRPRRALKRTYVDAYSAKRLQPPGFIVPCQPTLASKVPARTCTPLESAALAFLG